MNSQAHALYIRATGALQGVGSSCGSGHGSDCSSSCASGLPASTAVLLRVRIQVPLPVFPFFVLPTISTSGSSSAPHASSSVFFRLHFRPRFPLLLTASYAARAARATSRFLKLITLAFPLPSTLA